MITSEMDLKWFIYFGFMQRGAEETANTLLRGEVLRTRPGA